MTCVNNILFLINLSSYFRSEESGNCLHSYVSVADNSLVESLRVNGWLLTNVERERVESDLSMKIQTCAILSDLHRELHRDFDVEAYISKYAKDGKKL